MKTESKQPIELPPELSATEAMLASFRPETDPIRKEQAKTAVLLESCQLVQQGQLTFSREKLVETIVRSGEPEITLSLQQYTKTVRTHSTLNGLLIGVIAGTLLGIIGTFIIVWQLQSMTSQPNPPIIQNHYYQQVLEGESHVQK